GDGEIGVRHLPGNDRACSDGSILPKFRRRDDTGVRADKHSVGDLGTEFVHPIVVAGNGARAYVYVSAQRRVTDIAEVVDLGPRTDDRLLDLDEVAHLGAIVQLRTRAQPRKGADRTLRPDGRFLYMRVGENLGVVAHPGITQYHVRSDSDTVAQDYLSFEYHVDIDLDVAATGQAAPDIDPSPIRQRDALQQQLMGEGILKVAFQFCQLYAVVDPLHLHPVFDRQGSHPCAACNCQRNDVGQVIFALSVVRLQL